jgi:hypothetical protein
MSQVFGMGKIFWNAYLAYGVEIIQPMAFSG